MVAPSSETKSEGVEIGGASHPLIENVVTSSFPGRCEAPPWETTSKMAVRLWLCYPNRKIVIWIRRKSIPMESIHGALAESTRIMVLWQLEYSSPIHRTSIPWQDTFINVLIVHVNSINCCHFADSFLILERKRDFNFLVNFWVGEHSTELASALCPPPPSERGSEGEGRSPLGELVYWRQFSTASPSPTI
jgi:hypothetical protein